MKSKRPIIRLVPAPESPPPVNSETVPNEKLLTPAGQGSLPPRPNISQLLEREVYEKHQLRQELEFQQEKHRKTSRAKTYIAGQVRDVIQTLQQALDVFEKMLAEIKDDLDGRN